MWVEKLGDREVQDGRSRRFDKPGLTWVYNLPTIDSLILLHKNLFNFLNLAENRKVAGRLLLDGDSISKRKY